MEMRLRQWDRRRSLRPLTKEEQLDRALQIYREAGFKIMGIAAAPSLVCYLVLTYTVSVLFPNMLTTTPGATASAQLGEVILNLAIVFLVACPLTLMSLSFAQAAVIRLVSQILKGEMVYVPEIKSTARSVFPRLVVSNFVVVFLALWVPMFSIILLSISAFIKNETWGGILAFIGGCFAFGSVIAIPISASYTGLVGPVLVTENLGVRDALKRNKALIKPVKAGKIVVHPGGAEVFGSLWFFILFFAGTATGCTFMVLGLFGASDYITAWLGVGTTAQMVQNLLSMLPWFLAVWVVVPLWCVTTTVLYFDRRVRLEGLDIELLSKDANTSHRAVRFDF